LIKDYRVIGEAPQMGRNLFVKDDTYLSKWGGTMFAPFSNYTESGYSSAFDFVGTGGFEVRYLEMDLTDGQEYTLAFDFTTPAYTQYTAGQGIRLELRKDISDAGNINTANIIQTKSLPYTAGTTRQTFTFTAPSSKLWICINFGYVADAQVVKRFTFANFKMEFGAAATAWTAAPEDSVNLVRNSMMSKDESYWIRNNVNTTVVRDVNVMLGRHPSIKIKTIGSGFDGANSTGYTIPFKKDTKYTVSLWAYRDSSSPDGNLTKDFRVYFPEYNGATLVDYRHYVTIGPGNLPDKTWTKYTATFTTSSTGTVFSYRYSV
jgi:hypothetical protein